MPRATNGRADYRLSPEQRNDARRALALLDGKMSLEDAVRRALDGKLAGERVTLADGIERFKQSRKHLRPATVQWYEDRLLVFLDDPKLAGKLVDNVRKGDLRSLIAGRDVSESTRASYARAIRACWAWMLVQDPPLAGSDPTEGLKTNPPRGDGEIGFLTVEQCAEIMRTTKHRNAVALMLFAGIRPEELCGRDKAPLTWRGVNQTEKVIRIPAASSKGGRPRNIEGIPDTLWSWLGHAGKPDQPITDCFGINVTRSAKRSAKIKDWPADALRHTFATYAMAYTANAPQVSVWLGHEGNPTMLHRHYRGLATKAQAEAFFNLRPN